MTLLTVALNPSSSGGLPTSHSIVISNSSYSSGPLIIMAASNRSLMVTFDGLTNGSYYNITAVSVNCAGRSSTTIQTFVSFIYIGVLLYTPK